MKLKLILTFDHELPLGGVRTSYKEAMFDPTERVFDLAEKLAVPVVLFTDVLCAIRFKEWDNSSFYIPYTKQLLDATHRNHDVQLHLHPHWLTSFFENNSFVPSKDFRLADFKNNKSWPIEKIIKTGVDFLRDVCMKANNRYRCVAFRAGGFNIEDAAREIFTTLHKNGIQFDSSVVKGYYFRSAISEVNYLNTPSSPNWFIGLDGNIKHEAEYGIFEVPIASIPKTPFELPTRFKLKELADRAPRDHGFQIHEGNPTDLKSKLKMMFAARMLSFDNYTYSIDYLMKILDYNVRKYQKSNTVVLAILAHPKSMGDYSFFLMESFIKRVRQKYPESDFTTFSKLAEVEKTD